MEMEKSAQQSGCDQAGASYLDERLDSVRSELARLERRRAEAKKELERAKGERSSAVKVKVGSTGCLMKSYTAVM